MKQKISRRMDGFAAEAKAPDAVRMKQEISQLMDGELPREDAARALAALRSGEEARDAWHLYHLIGDCLRETRVLSRGFSARVLARLAAEPTVIVPAAVARPFLRRPLRFAAAGVAILALAALALGAFHRADNRAPAPAQLAQLPEPAAVDVPEPAQAGPHAARAELPEGTRDYLLAHQGYSPRQALQGYARTVSDIAAQRR